ncbi:MAG: histidine kinase, partial [Clostridia bacterium]|nr:histidine kinase [Clostridia bacterium]
LGLVDLSLLLVIPLVFAAFAVFVFIYGAVMTRKKNTVNTRITNIVAAVTLTLIVALMPYMYGSNIQSRFDLFIRLLFVFMSLIWTFMIVKNVLSRMRKYDQIKKTVEEKQMTMMVHQIKPHFIYNTLGAVRAMISEDPEKASSLLYDFSKYLRAHVDTLSVDKPIGFEEELENVRYYARIERARFGDKINVVYEIDDTAFYIPPLTVQPLVENAITHGLRKKKDGGTVTIRAYTTKKAHIVEVIDNGIGFDSEKFEAEEKKPIRFIDLFRRNKEDDREEKQTEDNSSGINNIEFRLSAMVGGTLEIKSREGEGTVSRIVLPKQKNENNNGR